MKLGMILAARDVGIGYYRVFIYLQCYSLFTSNILAVKCYPTNHVLTYIAQHMHQQLTTYHVIVLSYQLKLIKMHAILANLNHCAVPFLSRAAVNLCRYDYIYPDIYIFTRYL